MRRINNVYQDIDWELYSRLTDLISGYARARLQEAFNFNLVNRAVYYNTRWGRVLGELDE